MNLEAIPKSFWHTSSICLLVATCGLTFIAYKAEGFTLKFSEMELATKSNVALQLSLEQQSKTISENSDLLKLKETELIALQEIHDKKLNELKNAEKVIANLSKSKDISCNGSNAWYDKIFKATSNSDKFDKEIKEKQETIKTLTQQQSQKQYVQEKQQQQISQQQNFQQQIQMQITQ